MRLDGASEFWSRLARGSRWKEGALSGKRKSGYDAACYYAGKMVSRCIVAYGEAYIALMEQCGGNVAHIFAWVHLFPPKTENNLREGGSHAGCGMTHRTPVQSVHGTLNFPVGKSVVFDRAVISALRKIYRGKSFSGSFGIGVYGKSLMESGRRKRLKKTATNRSVSTIPHTSVLCPGRPQDALGGRKRLRCFLPGKMPKEW